MVTDNIGRLSRIDYGRMVHFDSVVGIAGTTYPIGTAQVPSNVIANVITMCAARNILNIYVHGALVLGAAMEHYGFFGNYHESIADVVNLSGQDVDNSRFEGLVITGAQGGTLLATYKECMLYNMSGFRGLADNCAIYGTLAVATGNTDFADFDHCTSVHGIITVTIASPDRVSFKNFNGGMILTAQAAGNVLVRGISGYLEVDAMVGGTLDIYADAADIQINADCTAGTINIYGNARVVNNTGGAVVNNYTLQMRQNQIQGGTFSLEDTREEFAAMLDTARSPQSGNTLMTGALQTLYAEVDIHPWHFAGGYIDWTGLNFGAGENTTITVDIIIAPGGAYRNIYTEIFLVAALPAPICAPVPRNTNTDCVHGVLYNVYGVRVRAIQAALGGGWNTLAHEWFDRKRGS